MGLRRIALVSGLAIAVVGAAQTPVPADAAPASKGPAVLTAARTPVPADAAPASKGPADRTAARTPVPVDAARASKGPAVVTAAYMDFLDRPPTAPELRDGVARLHDGRQTTADLVAGLVSSPQWTSVIVERLYRDALGREGDVAGVAYWAGVLGSRDRSVAEVAAGFYSSAEYSGRSGGLVRPFVSSLYRDLLRREPDSPGLDYWTVMTVVGGRTEVALRFYESRESRGARVVRLYEKLLGRSGDAAGIDFWSAAILVLGDLVLAVSLASSAEYDVRAQRRYPLESLIIRPKDPALDGRVLTSEVGDSYGLSRAGTTVRALAAASNTGSNTRIAFASASAAASTDQQSCATWSAQAGGHDQQGAVLRMRTSAEGVTSGVTVTKNVWFAAGWMFNVHLWNTATDDPFTMIASFDLGAQFRQGWATLALPWTLCARAIGNTVSFLVWPSIDAPPSWDDERSGGSVTLPDGWDHPGIAGWYIGHLHTGDEVTFDGASAGAVPLVTSGPRRPARPAPATPPRAPTAIALAP